MKNPFRYFTSSPEVIRLTVMMYIRFPLSLRQVEDLLFERGIDICHETVRFGLVFSSHLRSLRRYDEPKTLPYSINQFCPNRPDRVHALSF